jgi:hypothetical protein
VRLLTVCTARVTVDDSLCAIATVTLANAGTGDQ